VLRTETIRNVEIARRANHFEFLSIPSRKNIPLNLSGKSAA